MVALSFFRRSADSKRGRWMRLLVMPTPDDIPDDPNNGKGATTAPANPLRVQLTYVCLTLQVY